MTEEEWGDIKNVFSGSKALIVSNLVTMVSTAIIVTLIFKILGY